MMDVNVTRRFAEIGRLTAEDDELRVVAQQAVARLDSMDEAELASLSEDEAAREKLYQTLWEEIIENFPHDTASTVDMWRMSMEGVLVDHLISLWAVRSERPWRDRIRGLLAQRAAA